MGNGFLPEVISRENETPEEAALREVKEETGLEVELIPQENVWVEYEHAKSLHRPFFRLLENIPARGSEPAHQHMDLVYLARPKRLMTKQPISWDFSGFSLRKFFYSVMTISLPIQKRSFRLCPKSWIFSQFQQILRIRRRTHCCSRRNPAFFRNQFFSDALTRGNHLNPDEPIGLEEVVRSLRRHCSKK